MGEQCLAARTVEERDAASPQPSFLGSDPSFRRNRPSRGPGARARAGDQDKTCQLRRTSGNRAVRTRAWLARLEYELLPPHELAPLHHSQCDPEDPICEVPLHILVLHESCGKRRLSGTAHAASADDERPVRTQKERLELCGWERCGRLMRWIWEDH